MEKISISPFAGEYSNTSECSPMILRLRSLIIYSLSQFNELELVALTTKMERHLLVSFSQVLNGIRGLIIEVEADGKSIGKCNSHSRDQECLTYIVTHLIEFLNVKSRYVQHLVAKIFVAISEFLIAFGSNLDYFVRLLCIFFELALCDNVENYISSSLIGAGNSEFLVPIMNHVRFQLKNSTLNSVAGIIGILRGITKHSKGEDDELVRILCNCLSTSLSNISWEVLNGVYGNNSSTNGAWSGKDASPLMNDEDTELKILLLGNLIQLLCSLVGQTPLEDSNSGSNKFAILHDTCELVPKLLHWCFAGEWSYRYPHILPYLQHKTMMLMIRLSSRLQLECLTFVQWLELLHKYYQDLLIRAISHEDGEDDILDGSPFLLSLYDQEVHPLSFRHLQRQAIFLFLRCCLGLVDSRRLTTNSKSTCIKPNTNSVSELKVIENCSAEKKGLFDICKWLHSHVSSRIHSDEDCLEERVKFASSFIKLYIHEDDMLFEVLLQMFIVSTWTERRFVIEASIEDAEEDILSHISSFFNPLLLFHVFLAELQYDHQLLLEYLISKDCGSKCAEYLLRCLRAVCNSWTLFVDFSVEEQVISQKMC